MKSSAMVAPPVGIHHEPKAPMLVLGTSASSLELPQTLEEAWDLSFASTFEEAFAAIVRIRRQRLGDRAVILIDPRFPGFSSISRWIRALLPRAFFAIPATELLGMYEVVVPTSELPFASAAVLEEQLSRRARPSGRLQSLPIE